VPETAETAALSQVGVLGAGRMGRPIIGHLARAGYPTLVYDPNEDTRPAVEDRGARFTTDPGPIAAGCAVVLVCVGYEEQVTALMTGEAALLGVMRPGTVVAVLSTISPGRMTSLAKEAAPFGVHLIDAPVCRGGGAADRGELLSFAGGPADVVEQVTPVLRAYSSDVVRTGDVGTGQVAKAVNNMILWACLVADHEALALATHYGVDLEALRAALLTSSSANTALANWGQQTMAWAEDDLHIVAGMAAEAGLALPQSGVNREICRALKPRRYQLDKYGR
jgi:3-hydroxyisobutyrate dehydrogenase-like beta-hydroxyacid dehydrogenase